VSKWVIFRKLANKYGIKMKTESIRVKNEDGEKIRQASRELSAELQMRITSSDVIHELMECLENGKKRIKAKVKDASEKEER
jgi:hypothetical protein